jgi:hypothetical protein
VGVEPTRPKAQVPKTCVSAIPPLSHEQKAISLDLIFTLDHLGHQTFIMNHYLVGEGFEPSPRGVRVPGVRHLSPE